MDMQKLNMPTLMAPNWGSYKAHLQAAAIILDCWDVIKGEALGATPQTYDLSEKPTSQSHTDAKEHATATSVWMKKNPQAIGLIHGTMSPTVWVDCVEYSSAKAIWDALAMRFGKVGGAQTFLQMVNMVTIKMTNLEDLLNQIQDFQENYMRILSNGHSKFSEDFVTFTFCHMLPPSYQETAWQYLDNITDIINYKLLDIIAPVLQEENCRRATSMVSGSALNKFSTMKNLGQKCARCGKMNHSTQNHWPRGKCPQKGKGHQTPKVSGSLGNKNKKGKKRLRTALMYDWL